MAALQGTILANGINVTGGTVATFNQAVNTLTANSIEQIEKKAKFEKEVIIKKEPEK